MAPTSLLFRTTLILVLLRVLRSSSWYSEYHRVLLRSTTLASSTRVLVQDSSTKYSSTELTVDCQHEYSNKEIVLFFDTINNTSLLQVENSLSFFGQIRVNVSILSKF